MHCYARLLSQYPYAVLGVTVALCSTAILVSFITQPLPSFRDPLLGFEPRHTEIAARLRAWNNLRDASRPSGPLSLNPLRDPHNKQLDEKSIIDEELEEEMRDAENDPYHGHVHIAEDGFFCNDPTIAYGRVVFESSRQDGDLWNWESMMAMCRIDQYQLRSSKGFTTLCEGVDKSRCCPSWSIPNYVALLNNKSSCFNLTKQDIFRVQQLLEKCSPHFYNLKLVPDCSEMPCDGVPPDCSRHNAVYMILNFLVQVNYTGAKASRLQYGALFLPLARSTAALDYYLNLPPTIQDAQTHVIAIDLGLKDALFNEWLVHDCVLIGIGGAVILACLCSYTRSLLVSLTTIFCIFTSLGTAYFCYTVVFRLQFFPFMNLLAAVIAIGVGADDTFIWWRVWESEKSEKNPCSLVKVVSESLHHAMLGMLLTSFTTAAAFFSSAMSHITAMCCFSIFAGVTILTNLVLMATVLPSAVILSEKWCVFGCFQRCSCFLSDKLSKTCHSLSEFSRIFFEKLLPCIVVKGRWLWVCVLGLLGIGSVFVVVRYPGLKLPQSETFRLFDASHPFEIYDSIREKFWFERNHAVDTEKLPLWFVWGVKPKDNGDRFDPADMGSMEVDPSFDMADSSSQLWLLKFCKSLKQQSFYQPRSGPLMPNCFIDTLKNWMEKLRCVDPLDNDRSPCCQTAVFPYTRDTFNTCMLQGVEVLYSTPALYLIPSLAGPRFNRKTLNMDAVVVEYDSNHSFSYSFTEMDSFYQQVERWMKMELEDAPEGMKHGWWVSDLQFYDLQRTLHRDTLLSLLIALAVSFAVLFFMTLNAFLALFAIVTISQIILTTLAVLVLLDWTLNVLESVIVIVTVGLSLDYTLHYAVGYKLSPETDRESRVIFSVSRLASPVTMAAFTSFMAGVVMVPSRVLAYTRIGIFLIVITLSSWLYSTFFFQSLLRVCGPEEECGLCIKPTCNCCDSENNDVDKTVYNYPMSESTLSSSSTAYPNANHHTETHELEPLTSNKRHTHIKSRKLSLPSAEPSPNHVTPAATSDSSVLYSDEEKATI